MKGMPPGWNSIEIAGSIQNFFSICGYVSLGLLLFFEVAAHVYGGRKDNLLAEESKKKDVHLQTLEADLRAERTTLRALSAVVNIRFTGKWDENDLPFSNDIIMAQPGDTSFLQTVADLDGASQYVKLYGTQMYHFTREGPGQYLFAVETALKADDRLLGRPFDALKQIRGAVVFLPISFPNKLHDFVITVPSVLVEFTINNQRRVAKTYQVNSTIRPAQIPNERFVPIALPLVGADITND